MGGSVAPAVCEITPTIAQPLYDYRKERLGTSDCNCCRLRKQKNRCFPTKAVAVWHQLDDRGHLQLVERYLREAGNWEAIQTLDRSPRRMFSDPLYAVVGRSTGPYAGDGEAPRG